MKQARTIVAVVATLFYIFTIWVFTFSYARVLPFEDAVDLIQSRSSEPVNLGSISIHYRGILDNIRHSAGSYLNVRNIPGFMLAALTYFPALLVFAILNFELQRRKFPRKKRNIFDIEFRATFFWTAPFLPLLATVVAHDIGRWLSMSNLSLTLGCLYLIRKLGLSVFETKPILYLLITLGSILNITQGNFGNLTLMPNSGVIHSLIVLVEKGFWN